MVAAHDPSAATRKSQILREAAQLFARHGFHGVSIAELGAAVGTSGPALYRHFASKEALLAQMLTGISQRLHDGGAALAARITDPLALVAALVDLQIDFSLHEPELITVQDRDLDSLTAADRRQVRSLQRAYLGIWADALRRLHPRLSTEAATVAAHGAFGLLNSTPHSSGRSDPARSAALLRRMALSALTDPELAATSAAACAPGH